MKAHKKYGKSWALIQKKVLPNRNAKSLRERFVLLKKQRMNLPKHDEVIIALATQLNKDWSKISEDQ